MAVKDLGRIQPRSLDVIKKILQQHKPELSEKWKVRSLGIFGSYVRGEARKSSDLDLLVEIDDPKMGLLRFIARESYLSDLLGSQGRSGGKASPQARHRPPRDRRGRNHMKASRRRQGNFRGLDRHRNSYRNGV